MHAHTYIHTHTQVYINKDKMLKKMGVKWKAGAKEMEAEMNKLIELKKKKKKTLGLGAERAACKSRKNAARVSELGMIDASSRDS